MDAEGPDDRRAPSPDTRRARRLGSRAWLLSALAHALIGVAFLWLSRGADRQAIPAAPSPSPPSEVEVEITAITDEIPAITEATNEAPAPREPAPSHSPSPAPPAIRRITGGHRDRDRLAENGDAGARPEAGAHAAEPAADSAGEAPVTGPAAGRGPPDLSLASLSGEARSRLAGPEPEAQLRVTPHQRFSPDELRGELERQEDAVANVERGRVDPVFYDYLRGARARFETEARRVAESIRLGPRETMGSWKRGFLQRVRDVASEGDRRRQGGDRSALAPPGAGETPATDVLAAYDESTRMAERGAEVRQAEVCLDVDPGKAIVPSLRHGSGNAALDRLAVDSFVRAIAARPLPAGLRSGLACYQVAVSAYRMPPVPMFMCTFDIDDVRCAWPFKRITKVTGKLLSVDYSRSERTAARSLLRRAR